MVFLKAGAIAWALALATSAGAATVRPAHCEILTFKVSGTAEHLDVDVPPFKTFRTQEGVNAYYAESKTLVAAAKNITVSGHFTLVAEYCQPIGPAHKRNVNRNPPLQILNHGSTFTKEYWNRGSWGFAPLSYSWSNYMNRNGYATLSVDKLGNGKSSHPDPVKDVQLPLQVETIHDLITQIKAGHTKIPKPCEVIVVGHSSGSLLTAYLAQVHPTDAEAVILTGYPAGTGNNPGGSPSYKYLPAALSEPKKFPGLSYGYLIMNSELNRTSAFYYKGHYDPHIAHEDYIGRGSLALGEGFNFGLPVQPAYKGKVLVITGQKDPAVCGFTPPDQCPYNDTVVKNVNKAFSSNSGFDFYMPPTGHLVNWHYSAPETYKITAQKLGKLLKSR